MLPVSVPSFTATIYVGFRVGRSAEPAKTVHEIDEAKAVIQAYVDRVGLCVSVTQTEFIYTNGREHGIAVGFINYPRFPSTPEAIRELALELAETLRVSLGQFKVSVVFPDETVMLGEDQH